MSKPKFFVRNVRIELVSSSKLILTNFLFQKEFNLAEGRHFFNLTSLTRISDNSTDIEKMTAKYGYILAIERKGNSTGSTVCFYDAKSKIAHTAGHVCIGPDYRDFYEKAIVVKVRIPNE